MIKKTSFKFHCELMGAKLSIYAMDELQAQTKLKNIVGSTLAPYFELRSIEEFLEVKKDERTST